MSLFLMRYLNHLVTSEAQKGGKKYLTLPYVQIPKTSIRDKFSNRVLIRSTLNSYLWDDLSTRVFESHKRSTSLPVIYKTKYTSAYKDSVVGIIESLKKFPDTEAIIKTLQFNLKEIPDPEPREETSLKGTLFAFLYRTEYGYKVPDLNYKWDATDEEREIPKFERKKHTETIKKVNEIFEEELNKKRSTKLEKVFAVDTLELITMRFDLNFLKKEFFFTKLKYSRCPQYDAVSGGFAALFAGFIGFLISEKFGIELVDSGDFYIAFMYALILGFISHLLTRLISTESVYNLPISLNHNKSFFLEVSKFILRRIKGY